MIPRLGLPEEIKIVLPVLGQKANFPVLAIWP